MNVVQFSIERSKTLKYVDQRFPDPDGPDPPDTIRYVAFPPLGNARGYARLCVLAPAPPIQMGTCTLCNGNLTPL